MFREKLLEKFDPLIVMAEITSDDGAIEKLLSRSRRLFDRAAQIEQPIAVVKSPQLSVVSAQEIRAA